MIKNNYIYKLAFIHGEILQPLPFINKILIPNQKRNALKKNHHRQYCYYYLKLIVPAIH